MKISNITAKVSTAVNVSSADTFTVAGNEITQSGTGPNIWYNLILSLESFTWRFYVDLSETGFKNTANLNGFGSETPSIYFSSVSQTYDNPVYFKYLLMLSRSPPLPDLKFYASGGFIPSLHGEGSLICYFRLDEG